MKIMRTLFNVAAILALSVSGYSSVQAEPEPPSFAYIEVGSHAVNGTIYLEGHERRGCDVSYIGECQGQAIVIQNFFVAQINLDDINYASDLEGIFLPGAGMEVARQAPRCTDRNGNPYSSFMVIHTINQNSFQRTDTDGWIEISATGNAKFIKPAPGQRVGQQEQE